VAHPLLFFSKDVILRGLRTIFAQGFDSMGVRFTGGSEDPCKPLLINDLRRCIRMGPMRFGAHGEESRCVTQTNGFVNGTGSDRIE
jgi:hypothetical protein